MLRRSLGKGAAPLPASQRPARVAVTLVTLAALAGIAYGFWPAFAGFTAQADGNQRQTLVERQLRGAVATDISREFVRATIDLLPADARYAVETGDAAGTSTPVTLLAVGGYSQFQLLPRRKVRVEEAQWLLCYGCDEARHAGRFTPHWRGAPGLAILRERR
jgi:hypothetical protein